MVICAYTLFLHHRYPTRLSSFYDRRFLPGPFFAEDRIQASHHTFIRYYQDGEWMPYADFGKAHLDIYQSYPWRYDKLKLAGYERSLMRRTHQKIKPLTSGVVAFDPNIQELNRYVMGQVTAPRADSVQVIYELKWYELAKRNYRHDTIFNIRYSPR
jgi:hypothetical protein